MAVEPEKPDRRADQRAAEDRQLARASHVEDLQVVGGPKLAREVRDHPEGGPGHDDRPDRQPRFTSQPLKNGIASTGSQALGGCQNTSWSTAKATTSCATSFTRIGSPLRRRSLVKSSQTPMSPKPPDVRITTQM